MAISRSLLAGLHCPYCGSGLEIEFATGQAGDQGVQFGILGCACARYPIVEGIPILQQVEGLEQVVEFIRQNEQQSALMEALNLFRVKWAHRSRWHRFKYRRNCRQLISQTGLNFQDAVNLARKPQVFADYLFHRYANPSFLAALGPISLLGRVAAQAADKPEGAVRVLDLACGAGHSSFLMQSLFPGLSVISADHDFVSLYLAKRFVAPAGEHLCLDGEVLSPFADQIFGAVFCLDAFHYFRSKRASIAELSRVAKPGALWLFPHLHNALQQNLVPGVPLSPAKYLECFEPAQPRLFDERELLLGMSRHQCLNLEKHCSVSELEASQTLTLIAGGPELWGIHHGFPSALCSNPSRLQLNPIYRQRRAGHRIELTLTWPNQMMATECAGVTAVLPGRYEMDMDELQRLTGDGGAADAARLAELVSRFILVALPPGYSSAGK